MMDKEKLLAWLRSHEQHTNILISSVYAGLAERVQRGDFDTE